jgi:OOP family OmpA-OmpF porin
VSFLTGCAGLSTQDTADLTCANKNTTAKLKSGDYQKKVDNFLIIQDTSTSMAENLGGSPDKPTKIEYSKDLVSCLNDTLPDNLNVDAGLRSFGFLTTDKGLIYGMSDYTKAALAEGVKTITGTAGVTPIAKAINYGSMDLTGVSGKTAVILFSDGINTVSGDPVAAAAAMKETHPNVCIYTVLIGDDPMGKMTMEQIADASKCGFATDSNTIGDAQGMDKFVTDVFLTKVMKKQPAPVMKKPVEKISMSLLIEFDSDKDVVRSQNHDDVKKIADALKKHHPANVQLEGHTDSKGTEEYNMGLSKRRAESVKKYLVEKFNIKASRISTVGYGESKPVASNDTATGRQRNRRVVANIQ